MTESEKNKIEKSGEKRRQWIPVEWAVQMLRKAYEKKQIDESHYAKLCEDGHLWIKEFTIPVFAIFEFVFFVGWLKVAQVG
uniref:Bestrophin homolog n=1 Tax=Heterorhabditis bacteriophora TaxID=37862 RepID=A0A1I7WTP6_HETBA